MRKSILIFVLIAAVGCTSIKPGKESEKTAVIPQPVSVTEGSGEFTVTPGMKVYAAAEAEKAATGEFISQTLNTSIVKVDGVNAFLLECPISEKMLEGAVTANKTYRCDYVDGAFTFEEENTPEAPAAQDNQEN